VADNVVDEAVTRIEALGLTTKPTAVRAGLVACTGSTGCKFAAANTKDTAELIARHIEETVELDQPLNIHLTGCHHSCAQHYIGDIGLIGAKVPVGDDGDTVEGFHIVVGGGTGPNAKIGRELWRDVRVEDCPASVGRLVRAYMANRSKPSEAFFTFANRHDDATLRAFAEAQA
jgi:ferredoxin-nitrite reductase